MLLWILNCIKLNEQLERFTLMIELSNDILLPVSMNIIFSHKQMLLGLLCPIHAHFFVGEGTFLTQVIFLIKAVHFEQLKEKIYDNKH